MAGPLRLTLIVPGLEHARKGRTAGSLVALAIVFAGAVVGVVVYLFMLSILLALLPLVLAYVVAVLDGWRAPAGDKASFAPLVIASTLTLGVSLMAGFVLMRGCVQTHHDLITCFLLFKQEGKSLLPAESLHFGRIISTVSFPQATHLL